VQTFKQDMFIGWPKLGYSIFGVLLRAFWWRKRGWQTWDIWDNL